MQCMILQLRIVVHFHIHVDFFTTVTNTKLSACHKRYSLAVVENS